MQFILNEREYEIYIRLKEDREINLKALNSVISKISKDDNHKSDYLADKETCEYVLGIRDDRPLFEKRREKRNVRTSK